MAVFTLLDTNYLTQIIHLQNLCPKLKLFSFHTKTCTCNPSDANYPTDKPTETDNPFLV